MRYLSLSLRTEEPVQLVMPPLPLSQSSGKRERERDGPSRRLNFHTGYRIVKLRGRIDHFASSGIKKHVMTAITQTNLSLSSRPVSQSR